MCFSRSYRIYYSKRKSLKIIRNWHNLPSNHSPLDDCDNAKPILLTVKVPLSIVVELSSKYGAFTTDNTIFDSDSEIALKVYSKEMARELVERGSRVIVRKFRK